MPRKAAPPVKGVRKAAPPVRKAPGAVKAAKKATPVKAPPVVKAKRAPVKAPPVVKAKRAPVKAPPVAKRKAAPVKAAPVGAGAGAGGGPRKRRAKDYVSMGFKIEKLPAGTTEAEFYKGLKASVRSGKLPPGWGIEWQWRNTPGGKQLTDEFEKTIRESRGGWADLMLLTIDNLQAKRGGA